MSRRPASDSRVAVAYLRVSTEAQELGPEAQRAAIERWAAAQGVTVAAWFEDHGVSGATTLDERPGLLGALAALRDRRAGVLVAAKRDRIARDVVIAAMVERAAKAAGATLRTADGASDAAGPEGALMSGIVDVFAQYERALIRSRTKAALAAKSAKGERVGTVPFGFALAEDGRSLVASEAEQAIVAEARALRAAGLTVRSIAAALDAKGLRSRKGTPFGVAQIHAMACAA